MKRINCFTTATFIMLVFVQGLVAEGFDATKLPTGSRWEGTVERQKGGKTTSTSELTIRITKREGTKFEGEWIVTDPKVGAKKAGRKVVYAIEGTIAPSNRISFTMVKRLVGEGRNDIVGNMKVSGQIGTDNKIEGTGFIPETRLTINWKAKLAKD